MPLEDLCYLPTESVLVLGIKKEGIAEWKAGIGGNLYGWKLQSESWKRWLGICNSR